MSSAKPFVKAVGGKTKILPQILELLPKKINTYYEPFVGGGAVFWELANRKAITNVVLNDTNEELIRSYQAILVSPDEVIDKLKQLSVHDSETEFYKQRAIAWKELSDINVAVRFIYLNKCCFNGLYRVNKSGQFNVPYAYNKRFVPDETLILECSGAMRQLENKSFSSRDFASALDNPFTGKAKEGDAVYFDPPYVPLKKGSFTSYSKADFGEDDHRRLAKSFRRLAGEGVTVVLSNSDTPLTRELYQGFRMHELQVRRSINSDATKRGPVGELLITSERVSS